VIHYIDFIVYLIVNLMRFVIILMKLLCMYVSTVDYRCLGYTTGSRTTAEGQT